MTMKTITLYKVVRLYKFQKRYLFVGVNKGTARPRHVEVSSAMAFLMDIIITFRAIIVCFSLIIT